LFATIYLYGLRVRVMVFNGTFNNIAVISWLSVLLLEKTGVLRTIEQNTLHLYKGMINQLTIMRERGGYYSFSLLKKIFIVTSYFIEKYKLV
jgi:hypothetical protein